MYRFTLILIVFFCSLFCHPLLAQDTVQNISLDDFPAPENCHLQSVTRQNPETLEAEYRFIFKEKASPVEIESKSLETAEKYLKTMQKKGWILQAENWQRKGGEFDLKKDILKHAKLSVGVSAAPVEGNMQSYIALKIILKRLIPFKDVIGKDPYDVPRYPGSIRVKWMHLLGDFSGKYLVIDSMENVENFFKKELPKLGWVESKGSATLNYIKGEMKSKAELSDIVRNENDPIKRAGKMIPTTVSLRLDEQEGIIAIGVGRSYGFSDAGKEILGKITPDKPVQSENEDKNGKILTSVDIDNDLPLYSGLEKKSQRRNLLVTTGEEIHTFFYEKKQVPMQEALDAALFYLKELRQKKWDLTHDEWYGIGRKLFFAKDAVKIHVNIKAVGRYPLPEKTPKITLPVEIEVIYSILSREKAGQDIDGVPRYPGSLRFYTLKAGIDHIAKFKAVASPNEAEWFFVENLPESGWTFAGNDFTGLLFTPAQTAGSGTEALSKGQLIPTTLKVKIDNMHDGTVKIGMDKTQGDS